MMVAIGRSLLIFSDMTFKMATWQPYWIFWLPDSNFTLAFNINSNTPAQYCCIWVGAYWFSATSFSKWPPGSHVGFFGSGLCWRHGFQSVSQVCLGISISNSVCMLMVVIGRSLSVFSDVTFKTAAWWPYWIFWFPDSNVSLTLNIDSKLKWHNTDLYV